MRFQRVSIRAGWPIAAGLLALGVIPVAAGVVSLAMGETVTLSNARFFAHPLPAQLPVLGASLFCVLAALQVWPGFRHRFPGWHRLAGRIAAPADIVAGLSGLWLTQFHPSGPNDSPPLYFFRLLFGAGLVLTMTLGVAVSLRRNVARHRVWMMRAHAIGLGAAAQALTQLPWILLIGLPGELPRALLSGAAWVLNLAVAEWVIRRHSGAACAAQIPA